MTRALYVKRRRQSKVENAAVYIVLGIGLTGRRVADELAAELTLLHTEDPCDSIYFVPLLALAVAGGQVEMIDQGNRAMGDSLHNQLSKVQFCLLRHRIRCNCIRFDNYQR